MSLFGLDEMYNELLLEAKSPEEIKKILEYQFVQGKGVPQMILDKIFEIDPTKKKTYTKWVLMQWGNEKDNIMQSLRDGHLQDMFKYFQERANTGLNLLGMKSFEEAMNIVPRAEKDPIFTPIPEDEKDDPKNDFEIVYDSPEWRIALTNTWQANEKLGKGCKWCTAGAYGNGKRYFETYSGYGPLWVNFDKRKSEIGWGDNIEYPYTRYQFCFEYGSRGEMMDSRDDRVNFDEIDIPEDVIEFYESKESFYGDILRGTMDDESAWERYSNERYERTILLREPVLGNTALRLMPTFNEDTPRVQAEDPYEMYDEGDEHDSIDGVQYPDESYIYDKCEGYNMVVMKADGWNGDEEFNVYFEDNKYHGWRWTGLNAAVYQSCENGKFFADEYFDDFYFVLASNPYNVIKIDHPFKNMGSVGEANIINIENMPAEYQNGIWVMVEHGENMYGLLFADPNEREVKLIVANDKPKGEIFTINKDERGYYIEGLFKNYWLKKLSDGDKGDGKQHLEIEYFLDDKNYAIVKYKKAIGGLSYMPYGLYDLARKELLIKDAKEIEELYDGVCVSYDGYSILYDYNLRKPLTRPFINGARVMNGPLLYSYVDAKTGEHYIYDDYHRKEHGPFGYVGQCLNKDNLVIVEMPGEADWVYVFDIDTDNFVSTEAYINVTAFNPHLCLCKCMDSKCYVVDAKTFRKIYEVKDLSTPYCLFEFGPLYSVYAFITPDGKYNLISAKYGVLLPEDVDKIQRFNANCDVIPFIKNNRWFYLLVNEKEKNILPSTQGIPCNNILTQKISMTHNGFVNHLEMTIDLNSKHYEVIYSPYKNEILSIEDHKTWGPQGPINTEVSPEIISQIKQLFFPDKTQVAEQFKNIMNRMNNL
jgi:hypothetical protein